MKSKSINNEAKSTIVYAAKLLRTKQLCGGSHDSGEYIDKKLRGLGDKVYEALFPAAERKRMKALPDGWLPRRNYLCITVKTPYPCTDDCPRNCEGNHAHERRIDFTTTEQVLLPFSVFNNVTELPEDSPMLKTLREIERERREIHKALHDVHEKTWAVLEPIRNLKTLLERWPEVRALDLPSEILRESESTAVIVRPDNLNAILGIAAK